MGNQPSKKNKQEKVIIQELPNPNQELRYIETYPLLALFSNNEKKILKHLFLTLSDAELQIEEGKDIKNLELEERIISSGEIKEDKFIEFLKLPEKLNNFGKLLYKSFKSLKYIKKQVNAYEQESNIQKYLNKYEGKDKVDFEQFLFAISLYCMKLDEEVLTAEKRIHCIFYSLYDEDVEKQHKTEDGTENKDSDDLDVLLGLNSKEEMAAIPYHTIKEMVLGMAWLSRAHQISIKKLKNMVIKKEKEKLEEKTEQNKNNINEDVNPELIEKLTTKWKENLYKDMPNEVLQTLSGIHDSNKSLEEEISKGQKKNLFDFNAIDSYDYDITVKPDDVKIDEACITTALDFALPKGKRNATEEEKNNHLVAWKDWSKWYTMRAPNIFRILAIFVYNRLFNENHYNNKSLYLLSKNIKGNGIIANMEDVIKLNCELTWEQLFLFSWIIPNNCMESHINMDVLYQATKDGFSISRYEQCVRYYPGSTALFVIGDIVKANKETTQIITGGFVQPPWKFNNTFWGNNQCSIFELTPLFESCQGTKKNTNYVNCSSKNGIGFGGRVGAHRLWINNFFQKGGYQYDILADHMNTYTASETSFTQNFDVVEIIVVGFGGKESLEAQRKAWEFEKNEAERRNNINLLRNADGEIDKNFLKMTGIIVESAEDKGIERYKENQDEDDGKIRMKV